MVGAFNPFETYHPNPPQAENNVTVFQNMTGKHP